MKMTRINTMKSTNRGLENHIQSLMSSEKET